MNLWRQTALLFIMVWSCSAGAAPNFSYASLGYSRDKISLDGANCSQDGILLNVAIPLNEWYYAVAQHTDQTSDQWCGATKTQLGAGIHHDVGSTSIVYGDISAIVADFPWDENIGVGLSAGLRTIPIHGTEVKGFITYEAIDGNEAALIGVGANMWMNQEISGFIDLAFGSDGKQRMQLGIRYNF